MRSRVTGREIANVASSTVARTRDSATDTAAIRTAGPSPTVLERRPPELGATGPGVTSPAPASAATSPLTVVRDTPSARASSERVRGPSSRSSRSSRPSSDGSAGFRWVMALSVPRSRRWMGWILARHRTGGQGLRPSPATRPGLGTPGRMVRMLLADVVATSTAVTSTRSRKAKVAAIAELLATAESR